MGIGRVFLVAVALGVLLRCAPTPPPTEAPRLGVPPVLAGALSRALSPEAVPKSQRPWTVVALRPYTRARDLEALLLSTRSKAYDGLVVPGRVLPRYEGWLEPFGGNLPREVRRDLAEALTTKKGLLAVPLTVDAPVLVYRADLWRENNLPAPTSSDVLREAVLLLKSRGVAHRTPLLSTVPEGVLLRSLAASAEGQAHDSLHRFSSVRAMELMGEFRLVERRGDEVAQALTGGQCAAAFLLASDAARLLPSERIKVIPLPSREAPLAIFDGWCAIGVPGNRWSVNRPLELLTPWTQAAIAANGNLPVLPSPNSLDRQIFEALRTTRLFVAPGNSAAETALEGALSDVFSGGVAPEEALRRAEARRTRSGEAP